MPVIAMQVVSAAAHPDADALRVYDLTAPGHAAVRLIANTQTIYAVGDIVAVAVIGTTLADGARIRKARLRGVDSFGMALERVDAAPGDDLSARFGVVDGDDAGDAASPPTALDPGPAVIKWASVELLHHVRARLAAEEPAPTVRYRAKIKLDGTNAGVQVWSSGLVVAQSRSRVLTAQDDNLDFFAWVMAPAQREAFAGMRGVTESLGAAEPLVVFGEWCGAGIQKRAAIAGIGRRIFAVFAIQLGDHATAAARLIVEPDAIAEIVLAHPEIRVLPWWGDDVVLDFADRSALEASVVRLNAMVVDVEAEDPWVEAEFGVSGVGEGVVLYPRALASDGVIGVDRESYAALMFKAKGDKHQVVKQRQPALLDAEVVADVAAFVEMFVTESRLLQAVAEGCGGVVAMERMGGFLKWLGQDVKKESAAELAASGLEWRQVSRDVTAAAKRWYEARVGAA